MDQLLNKLIINTGEASLGRRDFKGIKNLLADQNICLNNLVEICKLCLENKARFNLIDNGVIISYISDNNKLEMDAIHMKITF